MPEWNEENIEKLASHIVNDCMDLDALIDYVRNDLEHTFNEDKDAFLEEWDNLFEESGHETEIQ